ncbi:MAG: hypothetical protein ABSF47_03115 [Minisyncoccia bacterium]
MKTKETVLEIIPKNKDNADILWVLGKKEPEKRPEFLEKIFFAMIADHMEDSVCRAFIWLMQSISDLECDETKGFSQRAEKAKELYLKLPTHEMRGVRIREGAPDETRPGKEEAPTLMKTREVILSEIASQCFRTKGEEESRTLFLFLMELPIRFEEEKILLQDIIRKTDSLANPDRLEQCFEWAMNKPQKMMLGPFPLILESMEDVAHTLAKGWVKNIRNSGWNRNGLKELLYRMRIFRPLIHSSDDAKEFLEQISGEVAEVDRKTQCLVNRLKQSTLNKFPLETILGDIKLSYSKEMSSPLIPIITITPNRISKEQKSELFGLAASRIEEWRRESEENSELKICLIIASQDPDFKKNVVI